MEQEPNIIFYAGFFTRFLSALVDIFILLLIMTAIGLVIDVQNIMIPVGIWWLYNSIMLTKYKATIGGKLFGIEVLDAKGKALSFKSASLRYFLSIAPFALYLFFRNMQHEMTLAPSPTIQQLPQLLFLLPPFLMLFTQKKQMVHDLVTNSVVIDKNEKNEKKGAIYILRKVIIVSGGVAILVLVGYLTMYVWVFYSLAKNTSIAYDSSFETHYEVNDYNDSKIIFYNHELETNSQNFVDAEGMYEIFEADVKSDLALNCIEYILAQEHNESDWINIGSNFRKNARNKYANTKPLIKKAKTNEAHMGKHFYYYDLNEVNHIVDDIANKWKKNADKNECQNALPVDKMYAIFIMKYMKKTEEALAYDKQMYKHAKPSGRPNKSFYEKEIQKRSEWLGILYEKHPEYSDYLQEQKEIAKKRELLKAEKERQQEEQRVLKMQQDIWKYMEGGRYLLQNQIKLLDFTVQNAKGQTPVMIAVLNNNKLIVSSLYMARVDVNFWAKDKQGKTVFDYIPKPTTKTENMLAYEMYNQLLLLEAGQIVLGKAIIMASSSRQESLKIEIQGADCEEFNFPKNIQCKSY
jgi:uncharacterized RDD family membrane protein YckC/ankyrin repeat protein